MPKFDALHRTAGRLAAVVLGAAASVFGLAGSAGAQFPASLSITDQGGGAYTFNWGAQAAPNVASTCTGVVKTVTYQVCYRRLLFNDPNNLLVADRNAAGFWAGGGCNTLAQTEALTIGSGIIGSGALCADVGAVAVTTSDNCATSTIRTYAGTTCHNFVHPTAKPTEFLRRSIPHVGREDSTGGQLGFGQEWKFKYALDNDANVTFKVFGPSVTFPAADAQGFTDEPVFYKANPTCKYAPGANSVATNSGKDCPVKVLAENVARPGENFTTVLNEEVWDLRDSTGAVVPNGSYSLWGSFTDVRDEITPTNAQTEPAPVLCPPNCPSTTIGYRGYLTNIPVNVLRIMNLRTTGITASGQSASIRYDLTGNANVRMAIGKPGARFMIDSTGTCGPAGFLQAQKVYCKYDGEAACAGYPAMTPLPGPVCEDPNAPRHGLANIADADPIIVSTLTFNDSSAVGISHTWNGSIYDRIQVSTPGVYNLAISAIDGFGNRAVDSVGNDGPIIASLIYDVTPAPPTPDTTAPTITGLVINCTNGVQDAGAGPPFNVKTCAYPGAFNGLTMSVSHNRTGETLGTFSITVTGPGGAVAGTTSSPDGVGTINFTPTASASTSGTYTISYSVCDQSNNCRSTPSSPAANFIVASAASLPPPVVSTITVGSTIISSGTSVTAFASITFTLATTTGATAGTGTNLSGIKINFRDKPDPNAASVEIAGVAGGSVTASGQVVTWSANAVQFATGTYYAQILPKDSNGTVGAIVSLPFTIPADAPPTISTITVGSTQIPLGSIIDPFSSLNFVLSPAPGKNAGSGTTVTVRHFPNLASSGIDMAGAVSAVGNTVTWSTATLISSTGTYTVLVVAQDSSGNTAPPFGTAFGMAPPAAPTIQTISINSTVLSIGGGTTVSAFSAINFVLATTTGTTAGGLSLSTVTVTLGGASVPGTLSASGQTVTWTPASLVSSTGTYTLTVTPKDSIGTAGTPVGLTFSITSTSAGSGSTMTQDAFKASVVPFPNPTTGGPLRVNFQVAANATVDFDLYTLSGRRVLHQTQSFPAGTGAFTWNLTNQSGSPVASGVYLLHITANDGQNVLKASKKVMILR